MNPINYSIIIPHKNIPNLLQRCIDSIPKRSDVEIIIVDDNSDPSKVNFNEFPGISNRNTHILFSKENKGAGYARNLALKQAKGKWVVFADADDYFSPDFSMLLCEYINRNEDLVVFKTYSVNSHSLARVKSRGSAYNRWIDKSILNSRIIPQIKYSLYCPWGKFYKRSLIIDNLIEFDEVFSSNDVMFSAKIGVHALECQVDSRYSYCSTIREGSLQNHISLQNAQSRFKVSLNLYEFYHNLGLCKYRINICNNLYQLGKVLTIKELLPFIKQAKNVYGLKHFLVDLIKFTPIYIYSKVTNK